MRSSHPLLWLWLAISQHPSTIFCYDGSADDTRVRHRVYDSDSLHDSDESDRSRLGFVDVNEVRLTDGDVPEGLVDFEKVRTRYGTDLKSDNGLWEVRPSPGKGLGVFARRKIPKGTRIIEETPLFTVDPGSLVSGQGFAFDSIAEAVDKAFASLNATAQAAYLSCPEHRDADDAAFSREALIFRTNGYTMTSGAIGIFPLVAKANHACRPNAAGVSLEGKRIVWAGRDIDAGEEVTVTYAPLAETTQTRRARLAQWGFRCSCETCAARDNGEGEADDLKRVQMKRLMGLVEQELGRDSFGGDVLPHAEELVKLVEEVGLVDYLSKAYKYAAYAASRTGKFGAARRWAKKELKVHENADAESVYAREAQAFIESLPLL